MSVSEDQLRCFCTAAKLLNFTKAAEQCYVTQPAFTRLIAGLEAEWGITLFTRTTRRIRLTKEGEECLREAEQVLKAYDGLNDTVLHLRQSVYGELKVSYNSMVGPPAWFIQALKKLKSENPEIKLTVGQLPSHVSVHKVQNGELDCAIVYEHSLKAVDRLCSRRLLPTCRYAVLRADHPLAERKSVPIDRLVGEPLIFLKDLENHTYQRFFSYVHQKELPVAEELTAASIAEMYAQIELFGCIGITAFPSPGKLAPNFRRIPIDELNGPEEASYIAFAWNRENRNPSIQKLLTLIELAVEEEKQE